MKSLNTLNYNKTLKLYEWTATKDKLHRDARLPFFTVGDIWWCAWGENIGSEINGKSKTFARPILIVKKWNSDTFLGIPLTSKLQEGSRFVNFKFKGNIETAIVSQIRTISAYRMYDKIGQVPSDIFYSVIHRIKNSL